MKVISTPSEMRAWTRAVRAERGPVSMVPTMGALHSGHLRLFDVAAEHGTPTASIFVNPLQFNRSDDFDAYPRPVDDDLDACRDAGVQAVYAPTAAVMYPEGFQTTVLPGGLAEPFEGAGRPGHFAGVTTVVCKLFHAVDPDVAVFGRKDFQQLAIVRRMVTDLDLGVEIVGVPTVREDDGVALSSRNRRLAPAERAAARCIPAALAAMARAWARGETDGVALAAIGERIIEDEPRARLEYLSIADPDTLAPVERVVGPVVALAAVWFGDVRLIDNCEFAVAESAGGQAT